MIRIISGDIPSFEVSILPNHCLADSLFHFVKTLNCGSLELGRKGSSTAVNSQSRVLTKYEITGVDFGPQNDFDQSSFARRA